LAYRLSNIKTTILDWKYKLLGIDHLLKDKKKLIKLWQETRDPKYKTAVNYVIKTIQRKPLNGGKQK
jgi:hypothetical protein